MDGFKQSHRPGRGNIINQLNNDASDKEQTLQRYNSVSLFLCIERSRAINEVRLTAKMYVFVRFRAEDSDTRATQVGY